MPDHCDCGRELDTNGYTEHCSECIEQDAQEQREYWLYGERVD